MRVRAAVVRANRESCNSTVLELARDVVRSEGRALERLAGRLNGGFCDAVDLLLSCRGRIVISGMGKAGLIGRKLAATLASTGTPSLFLHPAEAIHGDLGQVVTGDMVVVLSDSGETDEVVRMLPHFRSRLIPWIAITGREQSELARQAAATIIIGSDGEAAPLNLAPTISTAKMLAVGDALAMVLCHLRGFQAHDFARFHPGGSLGLRLRAVEEAMRPISQCRVAGDSQTVRQVVIGASRPGRRTGAIMLTDREGKLSGIFTDSDLAKLFEARNDAAMDSGIREVMTAHPLSIVEGSRLASAIDMLVSHRISELPVIDRLGHPMGMIDITDVMALIPPGFSEETDPATTTDETAGATERGDTTSSAASTLPIRLYSCEDPCDAEEQT
ncbi:MAG: KpsF/GutQ family sugar-phosphate isomerase [Planctomycetales bacterium]|nr:KpsF/GutQ family sugar-phosphate isomerase [Planctomycetales bacterium]